MLNCEIVIFLNKQQQQPIIRSNNHIQKQKQKQTKKRKGKKSKSTKSLLSVVFPYIHLDYPAKK